MPLTTAENAIHVRNDVVELARERLPQPTFAILEPFLRHYYDFVDTDDLQNRSIEDLYGAALLHWQTAQRFVQGAERLRVYNPTLDQHGWHSDHTVIEIVNDDMPFVVDSVSMAVNQQGLALHSVVHQVFRIWRAADGSLARVSQGAEEATDSISSLTSFISFEVDRCGDAEKLNALSHHIAAVLRDVRAAVEDWPTIVGRARDASKGMKTGGTGPESADARAFVEWMVADNFTFLGQQDYELVQLDVGYGLKPVPGTGLGISRDSLRPVYQIDAEPLPTTAAQIINDASPIFLAKADSRSTVHRPGYLDYVSIKVTGADGKIVGERRFIGLYASTAYLVSAAEIPIVRRKCANVVRRAGFPPRGHLANSLITVLETLPRDELFLADEHQLYEIALGILRLQDNQRTRLFIRRDHFERFVSCLVFIPRYMYDTDLRRRIASLLISEFHGFGIEFTPLLSESMFARIHFVIHVKSDDMPDVEPSDLEAKIIEKLYDRIDNGTTLYLPEMLYVRSPEEGQRNVKTLRELSRKLSLLSSLIELSVETHILPQEFDMGRLDEMHAELTRTNVRAIIQDSPVELCSATEIGMRLGNLSPETIGTLEAAGELFSVSAPSKKHSRGYPSFQAWERIAGEPLQRILNTLGRDVSGPNAFSFFRSVTDLLGGLSPVECLVGGLTASRELPDEALKLLAADAGERLGAVLDAASVYALEIAQ
ncbi:NAD-specific glutamate dehydrogenase [Paraburkholderia sp. GAS333]